MASQQATTIHGEVEYETVDCSSCGDEVAKQNALRFVIADPTDYSVLRAMHKVRLEYKSGTLREGWACPYCADDPAAMPSRAQSGRSVTVPLNQEVLITAAMILSTLAFSLWVVLG